MDQQEGNTWTMPPFWAVEQRNRRRLRRSYSLLLTSTSLLVLFLVLVLVFSLIVVPTLHSFASNIFKPRTVKNSWDSLNLVLVLFAIFCGFLSRNNNTSETLTPRSRRTFSNPSTPPSAWYQNDYSQIHNRSFNRLRSFNSYPDLRQQIAADERFRFYDDTYLLRHRNMRTETEEEEEKEIGIDNVATAPPQSPPQQGMEAVGRNVKRAYQVETVEEHKKEDLDAQISPPPPATRSKGVRRNVKRTYQAEAVEKHETNDFPVMDSRPPPVTITKGVRRNAKRTYQPETMEKRETNDFDEQNSQTLPSPPPPPVTRTRGVRRNAKPEGNDSVVKSSPPPPPPPPPLPAEEARTVSGKKKRGSATKEFLISLRGKKKKQRQRSVENFDIILGSESLFSQPPPPPPLPPPKVFQNLFSLKKGKHKNRHIASVATTTTSVSNKRDHGSSSRLQDNVTMAGNESPLNPIPPPPPLPPFKLPGWKFRVQGDFVRVDSMGSSRSGSPDDLDEVSVDTPTTSTHDETSQVNSPFAKDSEDSASVSAPSLFCPSPDVDTKAHNFIESFRAGLRMAKMNSMKERQGIGRSNLAPSPNHEWN
ncbi:hypothetical protein AAZX31_07G033500 [Glycine max]|nr:hypothetical protein JHK86_017500 [Glycine max]KAH1085214.1 hypothetical protein GYH30_017292 [Glycine max]